MDEHLDPATIERINALPEHLRREMLSTISHELLRLEHVEPEPNRAETRGFGARYLTTEGRKS